MKKINISIMAALLSLSLTGCLKEDMNNALGTVNPVTTAEQIRSLYKGNDVTIAREMIGGAHKLSGIVISDAAAKNIAPGTFVIQNYGRGNIRGIIVALGETATVPFAMGDSVEIEVLGAKLSRTKGSLQLSGIGTDKMKKLASNLTPSVKQLTIAELATSFLNYESTLITVNADVKPTPVSGETYSGEKNLNDGSNGLVKLHTETTATFAANRVPASAAFTGIATYNTDTANKQVWMRNLNDVKNASGPLYPGYPEDFESPDASQKGSYAAANITLKTGQWRLDQAILGNTSGRDRFNPAGLQCIRMQQELSASGYLQMNYDLPNGATKVTLSYGAYYTDASSTWRLEYSTNQGTTWQQIGNDISDAGSNGGLAKGATFLMNISGPVRFRINKLGLGKNSATVQNGRLSIDDFAVYQN
ncbi:DUF5689 domain-containing protein [Sediminibacterium ginsengisoli]|uniref:DUF5689 domain-containing protein n=1 Tax=Sediminibacterium ginsengisoli TaxID=413434 RepID=A0A1T4M3L2_9BACT|nr:DUF5689 domain-containing protein [Sediminibacterium ginsengisoli]SJZ61501.1 hypothetical protein SAMN04488132_103145 [Sediminibacterium ginsengisoli]